MAATTSTGILPNLVDRQIAPRGLLVQTIGSHLLSPITQVLFEKHKPPAVFMSRNAVLSSFATGRQTSLVVDMGHEGTTGAEP